MSHKDIALSLAEEFGKQYGLSAQEVLEFKQSKTRILARTAAYVAARERYKMSYPEIGDAFGRNHTGVMKQIKEAQLMAKVRARTKKGKRK